MVMMMQFLFWYFVFLSSSSQILTVQSKCRNQAEISALFQFKDNFQIDCTNSFVWAYPKTSSWTNMESLLNGTAEWDGVECDAVSGHVIGLDLSNSCLHGSINSSNSSSISRSTLGSLSRLTSLNLSYNKYLELNLKSLIQNLTTLEELNLGWTNLNSEVPKWLFTSMSSLRILELDNCGLYGEFPQSIFHLPKLQHLSIQDNSKLKGHLPIDFNSSNTPLLESLVLRQTNFTGLIPVSIGNLVLLRTLDLSGCEFSGSIPASLSQLINLSYLDITGAKLIGEIPSLENLTYLSHLHLSENRLTGQIPSVLPIQLSVLVLDNNQLTGEIPPGLFNSTKLIMVDLSDNQLHGPLLIGNLENIVILDVRNNKLSGTLELDVFLGFSNLNYLVLSSNNLTLLPQRNLTTTATIPRYEVLGLSSCRLSNVPELLPERLLFLDLSSNNIQGPIPSWLWNNDILDYIDLSHNFITSLDGPYWFPWKTLEYLDISYNQMKGSVPIPAPSLRNYLASNNEFTGGIPQSLCNSTSFDVLDLSSNRLVGELDPHCFGEYNLTTLNLRNNSFHGQIPNICTSRINSVISMIDLNTNRFQGKIPRSLANCVSLKFFDAGSNLINDTFPYWLGSLPELKVLILKDNALHGSMEMVPSRRSGYWFPELLIIDLSRNSLSGNLLSYHFEQWTSMKNTKLSRNPSYMGHVVSGSSLSSTFYDYSLTMYNKGTKTEYLKILDALITIDLSSNRLEGQIPSIVGNLSGLHFLNLSNNHLYGVIPSSLGVLSELESLDLSSNGLSGQIPPQLTELNFLSYFDLSRNNLTGFIPQGRQFDTFSNISYLENPGLCGAPLSKKCETSEKEANPPQESRDDFWEGLTAKILWMVVSIGFGGGLVVGVIVENMFDWRMLILSWRRKLSYIVSR